MGDNKVQGKCNIIKERWKNIDKVKIKIWKSYFKKLFSDKNNGDIGGQLDDTRFKASQLLLKNRDN